MKLVSKIETHRRVMVIRNAKTIRQAAERLGLTYGHVLHLSHVHNISKELSHGRKHTEERYRKVLLRYRSLKTAAQKLHVSEATVYYHSKKLGIEMRRLYPGFGGATERIIRTELWRRGFSPQMRPFRSNWDITCGPVRVEVKGANFSRGKWVLNLHRAGKLTEGYDIYIFRLNGCPLIKGAINLVVPAPLNRKGIQITPRTLMTTWGRWHNRFDLITEAIQRKSVERAA